MEEIKKDMERLKKQIDEFNEKYNVKVNIYYTNYTEKVKLSVKYEV